MKNLFKPISLLAFICLFSIYTECAAQYQSVFGNMSTSWNIKHSQLFGDYTDSLAVAADTSFNNLNWKKIHYYFSSQDLMESYMYLSEDITTGKVWYSSSVDSTRKLIADMSLDMNDSFYFSGKYIRADSVYFRDGKKHIRFDNYIDNAQTEKFMMIEGVTTNIGFTYKENQWPSMTLNPYLLCQHKDDTLSYQNSSDIYNGKCKTRLWPSRNEFDDIKSKTKIYPNPADEFIFIEIMFFDKDIEFSIRIYNEKGHLVKSELFFENPKIDISYLSSGIYLVKVSYLNFVYSQKIVKN